MKGTAKIAVVADDCPLLGVIKTAFTVYDDFSDGGNPAVGITTLHDEVLVTFADDVTTYQTRYNQLAAHAVQIDWSSIVVKHAGERL